MLLSRTTSEIGRGKDGKILKNIKCGMFNFKNGYVAKQFYGEVNIDKEIHSKLKEIDDEEKRFNRYHMPENECAMSNVIFQRHLINLNNKKLSKPQYRYLRESIKILHENDIAHCDLPDNVMMDKFDNMPRIIDWDNAVMNIDNLHKEIDNNAFMTHFKVVKK